MELVISIKNVFLICGHTFFFHNAFRAFFLFLQVFGNRVCRCIEGCKRNMVCRHVEGCKRSMVCRCIEACKSCCYLFIFVLGQGLECIGAF